MEHNLNDLRERIDHIDSQLVDLLKQRMAVSRDVALYKRKNGLPTLDAGRERVLLAKVGAEAGEELADYTESVFRAILAVGRSYQNQCGGVKSQIYETIRTALAETPALFPQRATVACQGIEGAYSQMACDSIFKSPTILYFDTFDHVFKAVESGMGPVLAIKSATINTAREIGMEHLGAIAPGKAEYANNMSELIVAVLTVISIVFAFVEFLRRTDDKDDKDGKKD